MFSFFLLIKLSFGGIPVPGKPGTFLKKNFQGCMENLYYNGINIIDLAKRRKHQIYTVVSWHLLGLVVSNSLYIPPLAPLNHVFIILLEAPFTSLEREESRDCQCELLYWEKPRHQWCLENFLFPAMISEAAGVSFTIYTGPT